MLQRRTDLVLSLVLNIIIMFTFCSQVTYWTLNLHQNVEEANKLPSLCETKYSTAIPPSLL